VYESEAGGRDASALWGAIDRVRAWYWSDPERHRTGRLNLASARTEIVRMALAELQVEVPGLPSKIAQTYGSLRNRHIQPFADALETVRWLRGHGCRLALLTNGNGAAQRRKIDRFRLADLFDLILIEGELGIGKPDPRIYQRALADLAVRPSDTWMAGDNLEWDVGEPMRLGIYGVWVDLRGNGPQNGCQVTPDRIVRGISELRIPED
jgi:putative hydrolase of the HAD superfamily